jgi:multiple sugar transport system ATP-binding protein
VASFVGTPTMNFAEVELDPSAGRFASVRLPDGSCVETRVDKSLLPQRPGFTLGIRAESLRVCEAGAGDTSGGARFVERLGDRTLIYLALSDGSTLVAEDSGMSRIAVGDSVGLKFDGGAAHLFDDARGYHASPEAGG